MSAVAAAVPSPPARGPGAVARKFFSDLIEDDVLAHAAALSFYTTLALSPLLVLALTVAGSLYPSAQEQLINELVRLVGPQVEPVLRQLIDSASTRPDLRQWAGWWSVGLLVVAASAVLAQVQSSFNRIWGCADTTLSGVRGFLRRRLLSAGLLLVLLFLTIVSLGVQAALNTLPSATEGWWLALGSVLGWAVYAVLFAALYHWLPDCRVPWATALKGGVLTAFLFVLGRFAIGAYLAQTDEAGAFGAAGGLLLWLLWAYYNAVIFLASAELLYALSAVRGWKWSTMPAAT